MPRRQRVVIAGQSHHITQRGNNRQDVFFSDQDRLDYIDILRAQASRHELRILGWCLMTNHVHIIAIPGHQRLLSLTLGQTHSPYSMQVNRQRCRVGHLWQNRFYSCPLDPGHLLCALQYVDLNPVRAGLVKNAWEWPWSSARTHAEGGSGDQLLPAGWVEWMETAVFGEWNHADWQAGLAGGQTEEELHLIGERRKLASRLVPMSLFRPWKKQPGVDFGYGRRAGR